MIADACVARNAAQLTILLNDEEETLTVSVREGEQTVSVLMTPKEREFWAVAKRLDKFTWTDLHKAAATTNKKTLHSIC